MKIKIVYGPPCSGKSTYVESHMGNDDIRYDYDLLVRACTNKKDHSTAKSSGHGLVIDFRKKFIYRASTQKDGVAWIITRHPTNGLKNMLSDLDVEYIEMQVSCDECLKRLEADEMRPDKEEWAEIIKQYFCETEEQEDRTMPFKPEEREYRAMSILAPADGERKFESDCYVEGYATTYNQPYLMGSYDGVDYYEQIDARALIDADLSDVIMQYDHEGRVLARQSNDTLFIEPNDKHGLFVAADMSKSDIAKQIYEDIRAGLVKGMSWAFSIADGGDHYDYATHTRTIYKIRKVYDVSAVSTPANPATDISARKYCERRAAADQQEFAERLAKRAKTIAECKALLNL